LKRERRAKKGLWVKISEFAQKDLKMRREGGREKGGKKGKGGFH